MHAIIIPDDIQDQPDLFDPAPGPAPEQYDLFTEVSTSQDAPGEASRVACGVASYPFRNPFRNSADSEQMCHVTTASNLNG
jgi:hypothetical protein